MSKHINAHKQAATHTHTHTHIYIYIYIVFNNGPGNLGSITGRVIPKTEKKMLLDATLLNTQRYKVRIKG